MQVSAKKVVAIEYTLKDDQGQVIDSSQDGSPLVYLHGSHNIIPGLEAALDGKTKGEQVSVRVAPEDAYGVRDEQKIQAVPRDLFGDHEVVTVVGSDTDTVTVDGNHPLAGEHLNFEVTIVEVRDASAEEISHGHVHGPGGHEHA